MNDTLRILKEPIQQVLRDFAYLDLEVCPADGTPPGNDWAICSEVKFGERCGGRVTLFMSLDLAIRTADGMLGTESSFPQQLDVIGELANVLAGNVYEIYCDGLRPAQISMPKILSPHLAMTTWNKSQLEHRYLLRSEKGIDGALIVDFPMEWQATWK